MTGGEWPQSVDHRSADPPEANDSDGQFAQGSDRLQLGPRSPLGARNTIAVEQLPVEREDQRDRVRRDLFGGVVGCVEDGDAAFLGGVEVDRVESDAGAGDDSYAGTELLDGGSRQGLDRDDDRVCGGRLARDLLGRVQHAEPEVDRTSAEVGRLDLEVGEDAGRDDHAAGRVAHAGGAR